MCLCSSYCEDADRKAAIINLAPRSQSRKLDILACWKMGAPCRHAWHGSRSQDVASNIMFFTAETLTLFSKFVPTSPGSSRFISWLLKHIDIFTCIYSGVVSLLQHVHSKTTGNLRQRGIFIQRMFEELIHYSNQMLQKCVETRCFHSDITVHHMCSVKLLRLRLLKCFFAMCSCLMMIQGGVCHPELLNGFL